MISTKRDFLNRIIYIYHANFEKTYAGTNQIHEHVVRCISSILQKLQTLNSISQEICHVFGVAVKDIKEVDRPGSFRDKV